MLLSVLLVHLNICLIYHHLGWASLLRATIILGNILLLILWRSSVRKSTATALTVISTIKCARWEWFLLIIHNDTWKFMRCILLHGSMILIAPTPNYHVCLLAEERLVVTRTCLHNMRVLLRRFVYQHLIVLSKVTLNFWCFVYWVGFGTTHPLKVSNICLVIKRVRILVGNFKQIKSVLAVWLNLLRVASGFACTNAYTWDHLGIHTWLLTSSSRNESVCLDRSSSSWGIALCWITLKQGNQGTTFATSNTTHWLLRIIAGPSTSLMVNGNSHCWGSTWLLHTLGCCYTPRHCCQRLQGLVTLNCWAIGLVWILATASVLWFHPLLHLILLATTWKVKKRRFSYLFHQHRLLKKIFWMTVLFKILVSEPFIWFKFNKTYAIGSLKFASVKNSDL